MGGITVVVPVYNVEKYLDECVESIVNQTYRDLEIILVEDGSPDNCPGLCDAWAKRDGRIRVIHQENKGLGAARNAGLAIAQGEYIAFADSDDWLAPDMYRQLYAAAREKNADIAVSGCREMAAGRVLAEKVHPLAGQTLTSAEEIRTVRKQLYGHAPWEKETEAFPVSVCMSLYRGSMIKEQNLRFREILSEDTVFNLDAYGCAGVITFTEDTAYCYRKEQQSSITQSFSEEKCRRYGEFLSLLARKASREEPECQMRAGRTAIDACRFYTGIVAKSTLGWNEKKNAVRQFAQREEIRSLWEGYPAGTLPLQQRLFHNAFRKGKYGIAVLLCRVRQLLKDLHLRK